MNPERQPRPGTIQEKVWAEYQAGIPRHLIATRMQLEPSQVANAFAEFRHKGLAPEQSKETIRRHMIDSIMLGKESIWPHVQSFAEMRMTPREIQIAARLEQGTDFPKDKIAHTVRKARNRGGHFARLSDEERASMGKLGVEPFQVTEGRVQDWLAVKNILFRYRLHTYPQNRGQWIDLINLLRGNTNSDEILNGGSHNQQAIELIDMARDVLRNPQRGVVQSDQAGHDLRWFVIYSFQAGKIPPEIAQVTGIPLKRIHAMTASARDSRLLPRPTPDEIKEAKRRGAQKGNMNRKWTENQRIAFSEGLGGILSQCLPFIRRGASYEEVRKITELGETEVDNAFKRARAGNLVERPDKTHTHKALSKARKGKPSRQHGLVYSLDQEKEFIFLRKFSKERLIPTGTSDWNTLQWIFAVHRRVLPEEFIDKLRLELYMNALLNTDETDLENETPLARYVRFGVEVDQEWFDSSLQEEQQFLGEFVATIVDTERTPAGKRLLMDFYIAYRGMQHGDESTIHAIKDFYKENDPELLERIELHLDRIRRLALF